MPVTLRCTVRGCGLALGPEQRAWVCPRGHRFDRAREGHVNLLQPQDRRSRAAGDRPASLAARARFIAAGHLDPLLRAIGERLPGGGALLDLGSGDGALLERLGAGAGLELHGLDLSAVAIARAARRLPAAGFVVANADRGLPYADGSFAVVMSITSRRPASELRRVLVSGGALLVAIPAPDDLIELRAAVQGEGRAVDRRESVRAELGAHFSPCSSERIRHEIDADAATLGDALELTYRGARRSQSARVSALGSLRLTLAWDLAVFAPLP